MACPICSGPTETTFRPFCSKRCADIDLGRWMTGAYSVPTEEFAEDALEPEERQPH
ncbi:MAG: DNA gyrase inhibitor YacG [Pseudomonadota bacterium]